jgi:hypothetical protein
VPVFISEEVFESNAKEALSGPYRKRWRDAIEAELYALTQNDTWTIIEESELNDMRTINSKLVFDLKKNSDGSISRFKARLVARGDMQRDGFDYEEVFSPTLRMESFRILLALAAMRDLDIHQMDISNAFVNADCDKPIAMRLPSIDGKPGAIVRLNKSLYGLKQAGRLWNHHLHKTLIRMGFEQNEFDTTVYLRGNCIIAVYVDDIILAGKAEEMEKIKDGIRNQYKCTDGGEINWILKLKITRDRSNRTISISQPNYITELVAEMGMEDATPIPSLSYTVADQHNTAKLNDEDHKRYRSLVGKAVWISRATRPDITHVVHLLARQVAAPRRVDWLNMQKLSRYLKGTITHGITLGGIDTQVKAYCDANFITPDDPKMRSISGCIFTIMGPVSWNCRRQTILATSTTESEYNAACAAGKEARWLQQFLESLGMEVELTLLCDNQAAIVLALNDAYHPRTKHIGLNVHWVRWAIGEGYFKIDYISTKDQLADILTKVLAHGPHISIKERLYIQHITSPSI